jgi:hypothetical protein
MTDSERLSVYTTIAAVLHLGNVDFEDDPDDNRGGSRIKESSEKSLAFTAKLMGLDPGTFHTLYYKDHFEVLGFKTPLKSLLLSLQSSWDLILVHFILYIRGITLRIQDQRLI